MRGNGMAKRGVALKPLTVNLGEDSPFFSFAWGGPATAYAGYVHPLEQAFSQRPYSVSSESQYKIRSSAVLDCGIAMTLPNGGRSGTPKSYPRELPPGVGGKTEW
jgi:hypothetical protein